jgi:hypothetical protein
VKVAVFAGAACILAALTAGCAEPPVKPIPDSARQSVTSVGADVSGVKISDTSKVGARGIEEGSRLGALQGAATVLGNSGGSLLGLILTPVGAAVGSAKGAAEAQSVQVVDETRSNLRLALQETDFTELLRQRLAGSRAGTVTFTTVTAGPASAATAAGAPVSHIIALEYRVGTLSADLVNPQIGVFVQVSAQVQSPDRRTLVHTATWTYCGERIDFVQMGANNGALLRSQIDQAAMVLGEAIPYDLYASRQPRSLKAQRLGTTQTYAGCMDFSDLPSRTGQSPVILPPPQPIPLAPSATPTPAAASTQVASAAPPAPSPTGYDGTWQIDMTPLTTTYGTTVGGECPVRHSTTVTFANGNAEGPWGKLSLTSDGELSGWMKVPAMGASTLPFIVNMAGRSENNVVKGAVSNRCTGSFTMRKQ